MTADAHHPVSTDRTDDAEVPRGRFVAGVLDADLAGRKVKVAGQPVHLTRLEFELLELLLSPPGQVRTRQEIVNRLWSRQTITGSRTLDTHMRRLRLKLEADPSSLHRIVTVRGVGFRFDVAGPVTSLRSVH